MSDQLAGYGNGVFRYIREGGCAHHQIWINEINNDVDSHGTDAVGGTATHPFTYGLRKVSDSR